MIQFGMFPITFLNNFDPVLHFQFSDDIIWKNFRNHFFGFSILCSEYKCCKICNFILSKFVPTSEIFWKFLMIMEDDVCILVLARLDIEPQLPHEEDLVGVVGNSS